MIFLPQTRNPIDDLMAMAAIVVERDARLGKVLGDALAQHVRSGVPLDQALGLCGDLGRSPRMEWRTRTRNGHLRAALEALDGDYSRLAEEVRYYVGRVPEYQRDRAEAQRDWPSWRASIHAAARTSYGLGLPETKHGLRKALAGNATPTVPLPECGVKCERHTTKGREDDDCERTD